MQDRDFLKLAVEQGKKSVELGGFPAGAIVVKGGKIISEGVTLYESLECCNMCFLVANWANISRIVYACRKTPEMVKKFYYEGSTKNKNLNAANNKKIELIFIPDFEKEVLATVKNWESKQ